MSGRIIGQVETCVRIFGNGGGIQNATCQRIERNFGRHITRNRQGIDFDEGFARLPTAAVSQKDVQGFQESRIRHVDFDLIPALPSSGERAVGMVPAAIGGIEHKLHVLYIRILIGRIDQVSISQDTVDAVARVMNGEDCSGGALFFRSVNSSSGWFDQSLNRVLEHGNHIFYTL